LRLRHPAQISCSDKRALLCDPRPLVLGIRDDMAEGLFGLV
jgi:hypothetical protein